MSDARRLILNTISQHLRTVINIVLSLISTRIVLNVLGQSDYGIYMLIAGVVSLLSFFTNSLVSTTQRHLSYSYGKGNVEQSKKIFANSYMLNCIFGLSVLCFFYAITPFLFDGTTLNIDPSRLFEAKIVYAIVILTVTFTIIASPFKALLISKENIVYISIVEVIDGILKLSLVFLLYYIEDYRLAFYALEILAVMLFNLVAMAGYSRVKYQECCILPRTSAWDNQIQKSIIGFTSWTIYGSVCIFLRAQGIAVVINRVFGTLVNASYGIANQIFGSIEFLSSSILNAFSPQIIKAEGSGNRELMLSLSDKASKYCYLLLMLVSTPVLVEMPSIIHFWLGKIPEYSVDFCRILLISSLFNQLTVGLGVANQAIGNIRNYTLLTYTVKALAVPSFALLLYYGVPLSTAMLIYIASELLPVIIRLIYFKHTIGLSIMQYFSNVILRLILPTLTTTGCALILASTMNFTLSFVITAICSILTGMFVSYLSALDESEKEYVNKFITRRIGCIK